MWSKSVEMRIGRFPFALGDKDSDAVERNSVGVVVFAIGDAGPGGFFPLYPLSAGLGPFVSFVMVWKSICSDGDDAEILPLPFDDVGASSGEDIAPFLHRAGPVFCRKTGESGRFDEEEEEGNPSSSSSRELFWFREVWGLLNGRSRGKELVVPSIGVRAFIVRNSTSPTSGSQRGEREPKDDDLDDVLDNT